MHPEMTVRESGSGAVPPFPLRRRTGGPPLQRFPFPPREGEQRAGGAKNECFRSSYNSRDVSVSYGRSVSCVDGQASSMATGVNDVLQLKHAPFGYDTTRPNWLAHRIPPRVTRLYGGRVSTELASAEAWFNLGCPCNTPAGHALCYLGSD